MQRPVDLVYEPDLMRPPREVLISFAKQFGIDPGLSMGTIVSEIWKSVSQSRDYTVLEPLLPYVFAGSTSIKWYRPKKGYSIPDVEEALEDKIVFHRGANVELDNLDFEPTITGAAPWYEREVAIRLIVKTRETRVVRGLNLVPRVATAVCTAIVDRDANLIEIRGDKGAATAVADHLATLFRIPTVEMRPVLLGRFSDAIDDLADALGGRVAGMSSKPELELERMDAEEARAIVSILSAITNYFDGGDVAELQAALDEAHATLSNPHKNYASIPFEAVVLAGLTKLALNTGDDIRDLPFYGAIEPYVRHQGSRIVFDRDGQKHSITVGFTTNAVFFRTKADESTIRFVRSTMLSLLSELQPEEWDLDVWEAQ